MERDLSMLEEPGLVEASEWTRLRKAHATAVDEYRTASTVLIERMVSHIEPAAAELDREVEAVRALVEARAAFFSAWHRVR
jgi:hypothetical protein